MEIGLKLPLTTKSASLRWLDSCQPIMVNWVKKVHRAILHLIVAGQRLWRRGGERANLIFKSSIFGLLLWRVQIVEFSVGWVAIFLISTLFMYLQPVTKPFTLKTSFLLVIFLSLLLTSRFTITLPLEFHAGTLGQLLFSVVFGFLFFILIGSKNTLLVRWHEWHMVLFIALMYGVNLLFFTSTLNPGAWTSLLIFGLFIYWLIREYFVIQGHATLQTTAIITLTITLGLIELVWVVSLLPLGFSKGASLMTLIAMLIVGVIDRYLRGVLTARWLRLSGALFIFLVSLIFISVNWVL